MSYTFTTFPTNWAPQKPKQSITVAEFNKVVKDSIITKKYDGNRCHVLILEDKSVQIFSIAGTVNFTKCLPLLCASIATLDLPANTFLDGELYIPNEENTEAIQKVINSGSDELGATNEALLLPNIAGFDVLAWAGEASHKLPYGKRLELVPTSVDGKFHKAKTYTITSLEDGEKIIAAEGLEGMVIADLTKPHNLNFNGNVNRGFSWKLKLRYPEDFLATEFTTALNPVTQANLGVGTLLVHKRNEDGTFTSNGRVGSFEVSFDRLAAVDAVFPIVVEISHFGRDSRGNLLFPKILRRRADLEVEWKVKPSA